MEELSLKTCPFCKQDIASADIFCPKCGKRLSESASPMTMGQKIRIYLASFFLAPLGLIWFFKYIRNPDKEKRSVALISLYITIAVLAGVTLITYYYVTAILDYMNTSGVDLNLYGITY